MRPRVLSTVALVSLVPLEIACSPFGAECNVAVEPQVTLDVHLPQPPDQLAGDAVTFCRNGVCASGVVALRPNLPDGGTNLSAEVVNLTGAPFNAGIDMVDEHDGFTKLDILLRAGGLSLVDGDTYKCTIVAASGETLFDVERPAKYDEADTCGSNSRQARLELYPSSASGLACGNGWCSAGVTVRGSFSTSDLGDDLEITLCRGSSLCASGSVAISGLREGDEVGGGFAGGVETTVGLSRSGETFTYELQTTEDSAALQDGDTYALTITQAGSVRASGSSAVMYSKSYPNGSQCDPVPCRQATVSIP
ncbi:MAG TPA: hypothetical protein VGI39_24860 [Polyangiaceae bacterium]|jgi:hypothetical protein